MLGAEDVGSRILGLVIVLAMLGGFAFIGRGLLRKQLDVMRAIATALDRMADSIKELAEALRDRPRGS